MALNQIPFTAAGNLTRDPELRSVRRLQARAQTIRHGRRRGGGAANTVGRVELLRPAGRAVGALPPGTGAGARRPAACLLWPLFADPAGPRCRARSADHREWERRAAGRRACCRSTRSRLCGPARRVEHLTRPGFEISMMGVSPALSGFAFLWWRRSDGRVVEVASVSVGAGPDPLCVTGDGRRVWSATLRPTAVSLMQSRRRRRRPAVARRTIPSGSPAGSGPDGCIEGVRDRPRGGAAGAPSGDRHWIRRGGQGTARRVTRGTGEGWAGPARVYGGSRRWHGVGGRPWSRRRGTGPARRGHSSRSDGAGPGRAAVSVGSGRRRGDTGRGRYRTARGGGPAAVPVPARSPCSRPGRAALYGTIPHGEVCRRDPVPDTDRRCDSLGDGVWGCGAPRRRLLYSPREGHRSISPSTAPARLRVVGDTPLPWSPDRTTATLS